jgi:hypothetical protein
MADHQRDIGAPRGGNNGAAFLNARRDRLLDQDIHAAGDAFQRQIVMKMGGRRYGEGIDSLAQQSVHIGECRAAKRASNEFPLLDVGIGNSDELNTRHIGKNAGMIAAHNANTNDPDFQWSFGPRSDPLSHNPKGPLDEMLRPTLP